MLQVLTFLSRAMSTTLRLKIPLQSSACECAVSRKSIQRRRQTPLARMERSSQLRRWTHQARKKVRSDSSPCQLRSRRSSLPECALSRNWSKHRPYQRAWNRRATQHRTKLSSVRPLTFRLPAPRLMRTGTRSLSFSSTSGPGANVSARPVLDCAAIRRGGQNNPGPSSAAALEATSIAACHRPSI